LLRTSHRTSEGVLQQTASEFLKRQLHTLFPLADLAVCCRLLRLFDGENARRAEMVARQLARVRDEEMRLEGVKM